jgi:hypothetical protein
LGFSYRYIFHLFCRFAFIDYRTII